MSFKLNFNCDNDIFRINPETEISRILIDIAQETLLGKTFGNIQDANGNTIGSWEIEE